MILSSKEHCETFYFDAQNQTSLYLGADFSSKSYVFCKIMIKIII